MRLIIILICLIAGCRSLDDHSASGFKRMVKLAASVPYDTFKSKIQNERLHLSELFKSNNSKNVKSLFEQASHYWVRKVGTEMPEYWIGTPWDFNGVTRVPGQGSIACGYFVTTLLRDMDFPLDRVKLAICPSLEMMKKLVPLQKARNLSMFSYKGFCDKMGHFGKGVYLVGLDFHTGLIVNDGRDCWFIHSNYLKREGVVKESLATSAALRSSRTRWVVTLTGDSSFLKKWLQHRTIRS